MTAKTITFAVQIGSGGFEIARQVADKLRYRYYDWEVTSQAAADAGVSPETLLAAEQSRSGFERIMERLMGGSPLSDDLLTSPSAATMTSAIHSLNSDDYRRFVERVVKELGERGEAVIVGHASQVVLGGTQSVLRVLVCGSADRRVVRLSNESSLGAEEARTAVEHSDRERISFFRQVYKVGLLDAPLYDVCLNTDRLSNEAAVEATLAAALAVPGFEPEARSPARA